MSSSLSALDVLSPFGSQGSGYRKHLARALRELGIDPHLPAETLRQIVEQGLDFQRLT